MKKRLIITLLMILALPTLALAEINMYGPGGPHTALQEAAKIYTKKTGVKININFGPQAKWNENAKKDADILFGASEQSALAITRDHADKFDEKNIEPLALRKSILLVKKGNPKKIKSIEDLARPGIGIIVNDGAGKSNTSGTGVWEDIAGRTGDVSMVSKIRKNIIVFTPNSGTSRKALETMEGADVWITWADWAISNPGIGEAVEIDPKYVIMRDMNINVRKDASKETVEFAKWLHSEEAEAAFKKFGWFKKIK